MSRTRILVVGGESQIGAALSVALCRLNYDVITTTRRESCVSKKTLSLDLAQDVDEWKAPEEISVCFLLAAMGQHQCEQHPRLARLVNVQNTIRIARRLAENGSKIVFPSTNLVFDCTRPDQSANGPYRPLSHYGALKAEAEQELLTLGRSTTVVRLAKVITPALPVIAAWLKNLASGRSIRAFRDLHIAPVSLRYVVELFVLILRNDASGIFQISGEEEISYCKLAGALAEAIRAPTALVECVNSNEVGVRLVAAPKHPSLDASRTQSELGLAPQPLADLLSDFIATKPAVVDVRQ